MKRVLFSLSFFATAAVLASDISTSNVLGVLPVTSASKRTIVSVPWCAMSATDNAAIQVSNLVKTANLTVNDTLHVYSGTAFQSWKLAKGADDVLYWQSVNQVSKDGEVTETPSAAAFAANRGTAIMLIRQSCTNSNGSAKTFYLYGQVGSGAVSTTITTRGSTEAPAYSLVAPAAVTNVNLLATGVCSNIAEGDEIFVTFASGLQIQYTRMSGAWKRYKYNTTTGQFEWVAPASIMIPAGTGFWYVSKSSNGSNPVFNW